MPETIVPMPLGAREENLLCWRELVRLAKEYQSWEDAAPRFLLFMLDEGTLEDHIEVSGPYSVHGVEADERYVIVEGSHYEKVWLYGFCFLPHDWSKLIPVQALIDSDNEWVSAE